MKSVDVDRYAGSAENSPYDALAAHNREYQRLLAAYPSLVKEFASRATDVADVACGTGNFTLAIRRALQGNAGLAISASDISQSMLQVCAAKIAKNAIDGAITTSVKDVKETDSCKADSFDLVNITHALNYTGAPQRALENIWNWLRPDGVLIAVDIGRELFVPHWSRAMFRWVYDDMAKAGYGPLAIIPTLSLFTKYTAAKKENENFQKGQRTGVYPMHSSDQFQKWVEDTGFEILHFSNDFYRDPVTGVAIDDLVVAKKIVR
jgi:ubiquinone/menaquinone biosynthesis C-methylase UbiE